MTMKIQTTKRALTATLALIGSLVGGANGAVTFTETFEAPGGTGTDGIIANLPTGTYAFDNGGWRVNSTAPSGVLYVTDPSSTQIDTGSRAIALGGAGRTGSNSYEITISGFTGQNLVSLSYGHYSSGTQVQGVRVSIIDAFNSNSLYSVDHFTDGSVTNANFALPSGNSIIFRAVQIGNTTASDSGIDNINITAVPEPSSLLLIAAACLGFTFKRRR